jgi:hypothetical protein
LPPACAPWPLLGLRDFFFLFPGPLFFFPRRGKGESSYSPVVNRESFQAIPDRMKAAKAEVMKRHMDLLRSLMT